MAGTIDQLNFEVILDDKKFTAAIERDLRTAKDLNAKLSTVLNLKNQLNRATANDVVASEKARKATIDRMTAEERLVTQKKKTEVQEKKVRTETDKTTASLRSQPGAVQQLNTSLLTTTSIMRTLSQLTGLTFSVVAIRRFVSSMIEITGQFELQKVALKTILQDAQGAERVFQQLYQFSSDSMYRFSELAKHAKQLAAFGIEQDKLLETTKMLGDVSAGLGVSMDRIILAYGHVKSSGFLRGIQLRSFSQNGVPILQTLADMFEEVEGRAVSLGEVFDRMTKRQIDFAMVEEAFRRMTAEGGQFHNIQEEMARTLAGEINVLKGRWENLMYAMGEETEGFVLQIVRSISDAISSLDRFKQTLSKLWESGSPAWMLVNELKKLVSDAKELTGKGSSTKVNGGGGYAGGGQGGGSRPGDKGTGAEPVVVKISNIVDQILTEEREINRLRKKAQTIGLTNGLTGETDESQLLQNAIESRDQLLKQYKDIMGVDYYKGGKAGENAADRKRRERIQDLKGEEQIVRRLQSAYDKLEPYLGGGTAARLAEIFGDGGDYTKAGIEARVSAIVEILKTLGKEGEEAAASIEASWGLDKVSKEAKQLEKNKKAAEDAATAMNKFLDTLQAWSDKNAELSGTGAAYKVSKALAAYTKAVGDANKTGKNALTSLLYGTTDENERLGGFAQINAEWARARANALVTLRQNLTQYADDILKEQLEGFDLTNWNDKSLSQINAIKRAIESVELPPDIKAMLVDFPDLLKELEAEINRLKQAKIDKTVDPERWKKIAKQAKYISERFVSVANALKEYADATGNNNLSQAADAVSRIAQNLKAAEEGAKAWGGWWGAVIGGGTDLIEQVLGAFTETEKAANELKETLRSIAQDTAIKNFSDDLKRIGESIFGERTLAEVNLAISKLRELESVISDMRGIMGGGATTPNILSAQGRYTGVEFTRKKGNAFRLADMWSLEKISAETGMRILDDYGNFNVELLKWIQDAGWDLTEAEKEWLDTAITVSSQYADAMKVIEDTSKSLLDNTVSDLADRIVDSWFEAGHAALDYADILEEVAKGYAKLIVQDMLMNAAFDEDRKKAFIDALKRGDTQKAMAVVAQAMESAKEMLPAVESALQVFEPYRNLSGDSSDPLGNGIKGITEDTANLLASYLNAIRADVSYMRVMQEKGLSVVESFGASLPTLNERLAQIEATNFDIAQSNQAILSELRSVIGAPGTSGMIVRVEQY